MPALTFFTARLYLTAVVADDTTDIDFDPQIKGVYGGVTITPLIITVLPTSTTVHTLANAIQSGTLTPNGALVAIAPIRARMDNGRLKLRGDSEFTITATVATYAALPAGLGPADAGNAYVVQADDRIYVWTGTQYPINGAGHPNPDQPDVRLVADTAVLDLPAGVSLGYQLEFHHVTYNAGPQDIPSFRFAAPSTDIVVDLATVTRI